MSAQRGLVLACYFVIFICVWGLIACMGGEWTKRSFRDICINAVGLGTSLTLLWVEACYG